MSRCYRCDADPCECPRAGSAKLAGELVRLVEAINQGAGDAVYQAAEQFIIKLRRRPAARRRRDDDDDVAELFS